MACIRQARRRASGELARLVLARLCLALLLGGLAPAPLRADEALVTAATREGRLDIATSAPSSQFKQFLAAFAKKYPGIDTASGFRSSPAGKIMADLRGQIASGRVATDVLHTANLADFIRLVQEKRLLHYESAEYRKYPRAAQDTGYWAPARAIGIVMAYNQKLLKRSQTPRAWSDLLTAEFANGKFSIKNPEAGTLFNQLYLLDQQFGSDFTERLAAQKPMIQAAEGVMEAVKTGQVRIGGTVDHWRAYTPEAVEAGIVPIYPQDGMPLVLAPIAILADAPHPNAAKLFIDFVLSREGQQLLNSEIFGVYSMRPDVLPSLDQPSLADARPLLPTDLGDYVRASDAFDERFKSLFR